MKRVELGKTGIFVSRIGIGTGTAGENGQPVQKGMSHRELANLLLYACEKGINFWDTARAYGTYHHIREALKDVRREDVVIVTKLASFNSRDTRRWFEECLKVIGTDYIDVCLMHGVRSSREFGERRAELETMVELKKEGKIRAVGLSSHGIEALKMGLKTEVVDVVWGRINNAGYHMDTISPSISDSLAAIPLVRKVYNSMPDRIRALVHPKAGVSRVKDEDYREV